MALSANALAAVSGADAARLGADLTPMGAEKAGNAAGTIPAWTGGITTPVAGFKAGGHYPDPFPNDRAKFEITGCQHGAIRCQSDAGSAGTAEEVSGLEDEGLPNPA